MLSPLDTFFILFANPPNDYSSGKNNSLVGISHLSTFLVHHIVYGFRWIKYHSCRSTWLDVHPTWSTSDSYILITYNFYNKGWSHFIPEFNPMLIITIPSSLGRVHVFFPSEGSSCCTTARRMPTRLRRWDATATMGSSWVGGRGFPMLHWPRALCIAGSLARPGLGAHLGLGHKNG